MTASTYGTRSLDERIVQTPDVCGGWIELGRDDYSRSLIRVLDIGGMLWEGEEEYETVAEAMDEAESFIAQWREENGY